MSGEAWEVPATINHTWGFRKDDTDWKSPGQIAFKLVDIVSKGGNYLLNVGPTAEGVIPQVSQDILRTVGRWLQTNGEAVYGARPTPFGEELGEPSAKGYKDVRGDQLIYQQTQWRVTTKPGKLYITFFDEPRAPFAIPAMKNRITKAYRLADKAPVDMKTENGRTYLIAGAAHLRSDGHGRRRRIRRHARRAVKVAALIALVLVAQPPSRVPRSGEPGSPATAHIVAIGDLDRDVRAFLSREMAAHLADIHQLNPPQTRVVGALTTGEYTWGTFMRALAVYGELSGASTLAGRDIARQLGDIGLVEFRLGGTRFSQLYASLSLRSYGVDLSTNRIWQSLTPEERTQWATLLDATKFYDPVKQQVINLPENYLGVAARIAAMSFEMGFLKDRALLDGLLDRAAVQFTSGALFADDALPTGRYDRYSNEYARYLWDAAQIAGRKDLLDALRPSLNTQMKLWWDLVAADGYGYPWGRSLGLVSYLDTLEIPGFLALNPEFRPAPLDSSPPSTTGRGSGCGKTSRTTGISSRCSTSAAATSRTSASTASGSRRQARSGSSQTPTCG